VSNTHQIGMVLAGHGSRNATAILEFRELAVTLEVFQKGIVEYGFLEFERPGIEEAIDRSIMRGAETVVVLPVMLTAAHHVKRDIPNIIHHAQQKHPLIPIHYGRHLDLHPNITALYQNRIQQAVSEMGLHLSETLLIVVGRGTSDATANQDVIQIARLLRETCHFGEARYCYTSIATPLFRDALTQSLSQSYRSVLILPCLLFRGVLLDKIGEIARAFQAENPNQIIHLARSLGHDPLVADALLDRFNETMRFKEST